MGAILEKGDQNLEGVLNGERIDVFGEFVQSTLAIADRLGKLRWKQQTV